MSNKESEEIEGLGLKISDWLFLLRSCCTLVSYSNYDLYCEPILYVVIILDLNW